MATYRSPNPLTIRFINETKRIRIQSVRNLIESKEITSFNLENTDVSKIIAGYNKKIRDISISNYLGSELPLGLGVLFLGSCKVINGKKFINHSASAKANKIVYSDASETGGNILKIFYINGAARYNFKHKELWSFTATKSYKSLASKYFKEFWRKCLPVSSKQDVSDLFKKEKKQKVTYPKRENVMHKNYDDINIEL